jgi:hypothetical protein
MIPQILPQARILPGKPPTICTGDRIGADEAGETGRLTKARAQAGLASSA